MKKRILFIALAMVLTSVVTSCGNKNDRAINKYEELVKKANSTTDPIKKLEIVQEAYKVAEGIKENELTDEQKERLLKINMGALEHATNGIESVKQQFDSNDDY